LPPPNKATLETRPIKPGDKLTGLSCGDKEFLPLKTFLQKNAKTYHERHFARTYGTFLGSKIIAYISLVCGEVVADEGNKVVEPDLIYTYDRYPAVKIARLMVDSNYRSEYGIGEELVKLALGTVKDRVCPAVGCRFVIVDSKKSSVGFYKKQGFTLLDTPDNLSRSEPVMFIDLHKAAPKN
jgi:ribosomal protein S18 acetylase RimI-like enzyme